MVFKAEVSVFGNSWKGLSTCWQGEDGMWSSSGSKGLDVTKERGGRVEKGVQKARQKAGQREPHDNYNPPPPPG